MNSLGRDYGGRQGHRIINSSVAIKEEYKEKAISYVERKFDGDDETILQLLDMLGLTPPQTT